MFRGEKHDGNQDDRKSPQKYIVVKHEADSEYDMQKVGVSPKAAPEYEIHNIRGIVVHSTDHISAQIH